MEWEVALIELLQSIPGDFCVAFGSIFSFIGGEYGLMVLLLVVLFCWKKEAGQRLALIIAAVAAWFAMIKAAVMRPRPYVEYPDRVKALSPNEPEASLTDAVAQGFSFPSIHSGSIAATLFSLAREAKRKWFWVLAIVLTLLVGLSRVITGSHYPGDVLMGWALGLAVLGVFELLDRYVHTEWVRYLILLAVTLPGLFFVRTNDYFTALGLLVGAIAAIAFDRKYVNFQDTRNGWAKLVRVLGAFVLYFGLNTLLKMPFGAEFLDSGTLSALLVRSGRYAIIMFVIMGVYPKLFPLFDKLGKKEQKGQRSSAHEETR